MNDTEKRSGYGHILKYTGLFGSVQGLNILVGLLRNKLVALLLGPAGMGLSSLLNSALTFISQATNLGISFSAVRHVSEIADCGDPGRIARFVKIVRAWSLVAALLGMLVCIALGPLLSDLAFSWGDHTLHFLLLSPAVAMMAVTGGETAILKGMRRLRPLAATQLWSVVASLVISVPIYYFFGVAGIVPVITLTALSVMLFTIRYSLRLFPLHLRGARGMLGEGMEMVRLGVAFILAGIATSGAEMAVRAFLNVSADLSTVGLYNAAYVLTVSYAGLVFSAMETDYFPRLSAVNHDRAKVSLTANRQIEVSLLIISPLLTGLIVLLPLLIPLLYSGKFLPVLPVARAAVLGMYVRAATLPMAYIVLAKGRSVTFLALEVTSAAAFVLLIMAGFSLYGLNGTGAAMLVNELFYFVIIFAYVSLRYGYRVSRQVCLYALVHVFLGVATYALTSCWHSWAATAAGLLLCVLSAAFSLYILYKKTGLFAKLREKVCRK